MGERWFTLRHPEVGDVRFKITLKSDFHEKYPEAQEWLNVCGRAVERFAEMHPIHFTPSPLYDKEESSDGFSE